VPEDLKSLYKTAFDVEPEWLIKAAARRQKWIDMGQSLNLYIGQASGKRLDEMYKFAWKTGLKTTYYLRSMGATGVEKSTINTKEYNHVKPLVPAAEAKAREDYQPKMCSILEPDCESCQ